MSYLPPLTLKKVSAWLNRIVTIVHYGFLHVRQMLLIKLWQSLFPESGWKMFPVPGCEQDAHCILQRIYVSAAQLCP